MNEKELLTHYGKALENLMSIEDMYSGDGECNRPFQVKPNEEDERLRLIFYMPDLVQRHIILFNDHQFIIEYCQPMEDNGLIVSLIYKGVPAW